MRTFKAQIAAIVALTQIMNGEEFDLYLVAGQSNMDGRGMVENLSPVQCEPSEKAIICYRNPPHSSDGWRPLAPSYSVAPKYEGGLPSQTFGPELGFVSALSKVQPTKKFALIKGSKGGTSLRVDWKAGEKGKPETQGPRYRDFIESIELAMGALRKDGHTAKLKGLIWDQGESDAKANAEVHQERLRHFMARIREDVSEPKFPIVLGEVFDNGKRDNVREAILKASEADPATGFISAEGTSTWESGTHFDAKSQWLLGERFAKKIQELTEALDD